MNSREKLLLGLIILLALGGWILARLRAGRMAAFRAANPVVLHDSIPASQPDSELIDINSAGSDQLQSLPGIGPKLAERIIAHRRRTGGFRTPAQLTEVPGIGPKRLAAISGLIRVGSVSRDSSRP